MDLAVVGDESEPAVANQSAVVGVASGTPTAVATRAELGAIGVEEPDAHAVLRQATDQDQAIDSDARRSRADAPGQHGRVGEAELFGPHDHEVVSRATVLAESAHD